MTAPKLDRSNIVEFIADIFERRGAESYLGEQVSMSEHMLQGAVLAEAEQAMRIDEVWQLALEIGYQRTLARRLLAVGGEFGLALLAIVAGMWYAAEAQSNGAAHLITLITAAMGALSVAHAHAHLESSSKKSKSCCCSAASARSTAAAPCPAARLSPTNWRSIWPQAASAASAFSATTRARAPASRLVLMKSRVMTSPSGAWRAWS